MAFCIFCGSKADSKEHIWPKWLLDLAGSEFAIVWSRPTGDLVIPGPNPEITRRAVCRRRCNNGWMSDLEGQARPVLTALFKDLAIPLDGRHQETIALWSVKTTMMLEALRPKDQAWFYDSSERHALRESSQLPPHTAVWLGRYQGRSPLTSHGAAFGPIAGEFHAVWGFVATLTLGALVIEVRSLRADYNLAPHSGPWNHSLRQVWPRVEGTVRWPPRLAFTDENGALPLTRLIRRWASIRETNAS